MVTIEIQYDGDLHCRAVHEPSQTMLTTDAPKDNQGLGESFSPTDLVATALGTCILTTVAIAARTLQVELGPSSATVTKEMVTTPFRRIGRLATRLHLHPPQGTAAYDDVTRRKLERAAHTCPVHRSLHPEVEAPIEFVWEADSPNAAADAATS